MVVEWRLNDSKMMMNYHCCRRYYTVQASVVCSWNMVYSPLHIHSFYTDQNGCTCNNTPSCQRTLMQLNQFTTFCLHFTRTLLIRLILIGGGKQRLQMARNQFIQGVASASIQLMLMQEKPKTVEEALELVQQQLAVETAQRRLHRRPPDHLHILESQTEEIVEANALHHSDTTTGSVQLELSRQVQ